MTKAFCDLCGKPAYEPSVVGSFVRGEEWSGTRSEDGRPIDGTFKPRIEVHVGFHAKYFKRVSQGDTPDLCAECITSLLGDLIKHITDSKAASDKP